MKGQIYNLIGCIVVGVCVLVGAWWIGPRTPAVPKNLAEQTHTADLQSRLHAEPPPPAQPVARPSCIEDESWPAFRQMGDAQPAPIVLPIIKAEPDIVRDLWELDHDRAFVQLHPDLIQPVSYQPPAAPSPPAAQPAAQPIVKPVAQRAKIVQPKPQVRPQYQTMQRTYYRQGPFGRRWAR